MSDIEFDDPMLQRAYDAFRAAPELHRPMVGMVDDSFTTDLGDGTFLVVLASGPQVLSIQRISADGSRTVHIWPRISETETDEE